MTPTTAGEWRSWLEAERGRAASVYRTAPTRLISDVHREIDHATGYRGREIVELLQNADDAGEGNDDGNDVAIVLTQWGVCVGNTGAAFSPGGVESLMVADNSPKRLDRSRFIGNKGLGFRSVLSWSDCPIVLSGPLDLAFDRHQAELWLAALCGAAPELLDRVAIHREEIGREWPVPVLAAPFFLEGTVETGLLRHHGDNALRTLAAARALRAEGFDTVIALPFLTSDVKPEVVRQIKHVGRDALLFTRHLRSLRITTDTKEAETWRVLREGEKLLLNDPSGSDSLWRVYSKDGLVPPEHWGDRKHAKPPTWEVKLAVSADKVENDGFLYCFFPTQVRFPFPVVAHATVELTPNRQNLVDTAENRFIVGEVASALVELAASQRTPAAPWAALQTVAARDGTQVDPVLVQMGFNEALTKGLAARDLVPLRGGGFARATNTSRMESNCEAWLPPVGFEDVALWTDDPALRRALGLLRVAALEWGEVKRRIEAVAPALSAPERAAIVAGVHRALLADKIAPAVLIDQAGSVLRPTEPSFLPPGDGWSAPLPTWTELRFLDSELVSELKKALKVETVRDLSTRLKLWGVSEYSLSSVASHVSARLRERIATHPATADQARGEALATYFALFSTSPDTARPAALRVELPTIQGGWRQADTLYFGAGYGEGRLCGALYVGAPQKLVANPATVLPGESAAAVARFLLWAGVAKLPRETQTDSEPGYKAYVGSRLRYPADLGDFQLRSAKEFDRCSVDSCRTVDELAIILGKADPEVVLAWCAEDVRIERWAREGETDFMLRAPGKRQSRQLVGQRIPAFFQWKVASTPWLPTQLGGARPPARCLQEGFTAGELRKVLPLPTISRGHPALDLGQRPSMMLRELLRRVGVAMSLSELPIDDCLEIVRELQTTDPHGFAARALYREVVGRFDDERPSEAAWASYLRNARLRGRVGEAGDWYAIDSLLYDDTGALPPPLRRQIPLLDLDTKRGARKVKELLGVPSVDPQSLKVEVKHHVLDPRANRLQDSLAPLRPYILCLAPSQDAAARSVVVLRHLSVALCHSASGTASVSGRSYSFELREVGERIAADATVYLIVDESDQGVSVSDPVFADRVGQAVSSLLRFDAGADVARLLSCPGERRHELLAQIRGWSKEETETELKRAADRLEMDLDKFELFESVPPVPPTPPAAAPVAKPAPPVPSPPVKTAEPGPESPPTSAVVTPVTLPPPAPRRTISHRVKATPRTSPNVPSGPPADGPACEHLAILFETAEKRFPLLVAHVQGDLAPGCDVVSFGSPEDREIFRLAAKANQDRVLRFIEVKARSSGTSVIPLRGNELSRAGDFRERFWLYRFYELDDGKYDLVTLANPLTGSCQKVVEVDLLRSSGSLAYIVEGIPDVGTAQPPGPE